MVIINASSMYHIFSYFMLESTSLDLRRACLQDMGFTDVFTTIQLAFI